MAGFESLCFCDARNVGMGCLRQMARLAEDLKVIVFVCAAHGEGQYVINFPRFAGFDLLSAV
jgi:hypothetical protein